MRSAQFDRASVAGGKRRILGLVSTTPDRADGVDDVLRRQPVAPGDLGIARLAAVQRTALYQKLWPCSAMNGAIHSAATEQRRIRRVDDRVNAQAGDVRDDDFQARIAELARSQPQAEAGALTVTPLSASSCCNSPA